MTSSSMDSLDIKSCLHTHTYIIWLSIFLAVTVVLIGTYMNFDDSKYTKVPPSGSGGEECKLRILSLYVQDSVTCCDGVKNMVCSAYTDTSNKIFSSVWAFFIPLIPFGIALTSEYLYLCVSSRLEDFAIIFVKHSFFCARRFIIYAAVVAVRTVILFMVPMRLTSLYYSISPNSESLCWCSDLISPKK